jgi:hypothetical protein
MNEEGERSLMDLLFNLASEAVSSRVRIRALLELLEEKGVISAAEFDERGQVIWERDWEEIAAEVAPDILLDEGR